tara:strand:- start:62 stop:214 length:153 start_codon:yes stop_codon:yes gene_type:complete
MPTKQNVINAIIADYEKTRKNFDNYNYVLNIIKKHGRTEETKEKTTTSSN